MSNQATIERAYKVIEHILALKESVADQNNVRACQCFMALYNDDQKTIIKERIIKTQDLTVFYNVVLPKEHNPTLDIIHLHYNYLIEIIYQHIDDIETSQSRLKALVTVVELWKPTPNFSTGTTSVINVV